MAMDKLFKGIQQVMSLPANPEKGVIYLVGNGEKGGNGTGIYFGTRWYGKTLDDTAVKALITRLGTAEGKISNIEAALGEWESLGANLETVAKVVAKHQERLNAHDINIATANTNASEAVATANTAKSTADEAKQIAENAVKDVTAQVEAAQDAQEAAAQSATDAEGHASTASTKAGEASTSASAAAQSATDAEGHASTASTKAGEASTSASAAAQSATDAEASAQAAEAAKIAAENSNTSATAIANKAAEDAATAKADAAAALDSVKDGVNFKGIVDESNLDLDTNLPYTDDYVNGDIVIVDYRGSNGGTYEYILHESSYGEETTKEWVELGNVNPALEQITSSIEKLDANVDSEGGTYISLNVVETDGKITAVTVNDTALESVVNKSHEHDNKTVLDGITSNKVSAWDSAVQTVLVADGCDMLTATKNSTTVTLALYYGGDDAE